MVKIRFIGAGARVVIGSFFRWADEPLESTWCESIYFTDRDVDEVRCFIADRDRLLDEVRD